MKNDKLNLRQKEIIKILTKSTVNNPITTSVIAKELSLSSRTVLREMPKIEEWLDENEFKFSIKRIFNIYQVFKICHSIIYCFFKITNRFKLP